jgi:hypothetical protein
MARSFRSSPRGESGRSRSGTPRSHGCSRRGLRSRSCRRPLRCSPTSIICSCSVYFTSAESGRRFGSYQPDNRGARIIEIRATRKRNALEGATGSDPFDLYINSAPGARIAAVLETQRDCKCVREDDESATTLSKRIPQERLRIMSVRMRRTWTAYVRRCRKSVA